MKAAIIEIKSAAIIEIKYLLKSKYSARNEIKEKQAS